MLNQSGPRAVARPGRTRATAGLVLWGLAASAPAGAEDDPCRRPAGPAAVWRCALARSPEVRLSRDELRVLAGRRRAAGTWLPANPVLSFSAADRRLFNGTGAPTFNWYLALSQEIQIGGQRRLRLDVADAEAAAQVRRVAAAEREAGAAALAAYYEVLAAAEERRLADEIGRLAATLAEVGAARAREALLSPVDADVARAEAARAALSRPEAGRRHEAARALLGALLGLPGPADADGPLEAPPPGAPDLPALVERALLLRGDVGAAEMERQAALARVRLLRRERVPDLTLTFQAQRDGFDERVLGGGISLPLPLPAPLGPSRAGEIAAAEARAAQAETGVALQRRRVQLEVERAVSGERAAAEALALLPAELIERARVDLRALSAGLSARQLSVREALLMQRSLIELLQAHVRARLQLALARVELGRAAGLPLGGTP